MFTDLLFMHMLGYTKYENWSLTKTNSFAACFVSNAFNKHRFMGINTNSVLYEPQTIAIHDYEWIGALEAQNTTR